LTFGTSFESVRLILDLASWPDDLRGGAVAIGNFDGVHVGHARIVDALRAEARRVGGPAVVFTFDPHPVRLLRPEEAPPPLTWTERKAELLARLGIDALVAYPTDEALLRLSAEDFFGRIVVLGIGAWAMVEGPNFRFGRGRAGNVESLAGMCEAAGMTLNVVGPVADGGGIVSSSRIRRLIAAGDIDAARPLLTEPYRIRGMVVHGARRGATIGFPTANIAAVDTLVPGPGVYAGRGWLRSSSAASGRGESWPAAINVGPNPTFGESATKIEAHLVGCDRSLYGEVLEVDFAARLRDTRAFAGVEELKGQLRRDVDEVVRLAAVVGEPRDE
jgi:riboflavin kinase/FMN adenylyltransferase